MIRLILVLLSTIFLTACATSNAALNGKATLAKKPGTLLFAHELLLEPVSAQCDQAVEAAMLKFETGVVVCKKSHRFFLFSHGEVLREGPTGTARYDMGYETPVGEFFVYRMEGADYVSRQYNAPMGYAVFYFKGHALHASTNCKRIWNASTQMKQLGFRIDNSHGCVNLCTFDAIYVYENLDIGDAVIVVPW